MASQALARADTLSVFNALPIDGLPGSHVQTSRRIIQTKSATFLRESVRNLILRNATKEDVRDILPILSGLDSLHITSGWEVLYRGDSPPAPGLEGLRIHHLCCDASEIFDLKKIEPLHHPCFAQLTHLELFHAPHQSDINTVARAIYTGFADLPRLTHLAFDTSTISVVSVCMEILHIYQRLQVLVIVCRWPQKWATEILAYDPRFVVMHRGLWPPEFDWQRGVLTGADFWERAEAFVTKRVSGEIDRRTFILEKNPEDY
ncbi:hypothetical protein C8R43DRAFT_1121152 [Mycena crocata]|nr:hypothetical protein C8R43DRAFT_1121152 [Mycena crocata]